MLENQYQSYHAHVYFDETSLEQAKDLYIKIKSEWAVSLGRIHERPVGPHPKWSFQILFNQSNFQPFINWLELHRNGLTVFIHASTKEDYKDHTERVLWLGEKAELKLDLFR